MKRERDVILDKGLTRVVTGTYCPYVSTETFVDREVAVSYTHLDVYKRQIW